MKTILILLLLCSNAMAGDLPNLGEPTSRYDLTKGQIAAETVFAALWFVDYRQTMGIKTYCTKMYPGQGTVDSNGTIRWPNGDYCEPYEVNPVLGRHPSDARIRNYFVGVGLAQFAITKALPSAYRPYWQGAWIVTEIALVVKNRKLGLTFSF